jgi:hypothetical protein
MAIALAGSHLVEGEQLQDALARLGQPACDGGEIADVADAPAR